MIISFPQKAKPKGPPAPNCDANAGPVILQLQPLGLPATVDTIELVRSSLRIMQVPVSLQETEEPSGPITLAEGLERMAVEAGPSVDHPGTLYDPASVDTDPVEAWYLRIRWLYVSAIYRSPAKKACKQGAEGHSAAAPMLIQFLHCIS